MFYSRSQDQTNPYRGDSLIVGEPDIRADIKKILTEERRGREVVLRRARRHQDKTPVQCECRKQTGRNNEPEFGCRVCDGNGYLFDDFPVVGYLNSSSLEKDKGKIKNYGNKETQSEILYLEYDCLYRYTEDTLDFPDKFDMVWVPKKDINGKTISPLAPEMSYNIQVVDPFRLDSRGRIEYYKIILTSHYRRSSEQ